MRIGAWSKSGRSLAKAGWGGVLCGLVAMCLSTPAQAQVTNIQLLYVNDYRQTATNAFTNLGAQLQPILLVQNVTDISEANVVSPDEEFLDLETFGGGAYFGSFGVFSTQASLMSSFGAGDYVVNWSGGTLTPANSVVNQPFATGIWPSQFPRFTTTTFTSAAGMDPSQPFNFALVSSFFPSASSESNTGGFYISTVQTSGLPGGIIYSQIVSGTGATLSSRILPAGTLQPNTQYFVTWLYAAAIVDDPPLIGTTRVEFRVTTRLLFTTGSPAPTCDSIDFNRDTLSPDSGDLDDFIAVLAGGPSACSTFPTPGCNDVDFNNDGIFPDSSDLDAFLSRLAGGPCAP
jgi:hypothetical protein